MAVRGYVTFEDAQNSAVGVSAERPDTPPPGRALADDLARGLQKGGLTLSYPVTQWESYGWEFTVNADGRDVWFMLQSTAWPETEEGDRGDPGGEWLVLSDVPRGFREKLRGARFDGPHEKAIRVLESVLAPPRFANVRWFTKEGFQSGGESSPSP